MKLITNCGDEYFILSTGKVLIAHSYMLSFGGVDSDGAYTHVCYKDGEQVLDYFTHDELLEVAEYMVACWIALRDKAREGTYMPSKKVTPCI